MSRRTTFGAFVVVALLLIAAAPASAKGPTRVAIHDLRTGSTTVLTDSQNKMFELMDVVGWPEGRSEPPGLDSGALEHVATLSWTFDDKTPLWVDRIYADDSGETWVQRRDFHFGGGAVTWGQVTDGNDLTGLLSAVEDPNQPTTSSLQAPVGAAPRLESGSVSSTAVDGVLTGWGVGLLALPVVGLALAFGWRRVSPARRVSGR
jgi:hypothetical protein